MWEMQYVKLSSTGLLNVAEFTPHLQQCTTVAFRDSSQPPKALTENAINQPLPLEHSKCQINAAGIPTICTWFCIKNTAPWLKIRWTYLIKCIRQGVTQCLLFSILQWIFLRQPNDNSLSIKICSQTTNKSHSGERKKEGENMKHSRAILNSRGWQRTQVSRHLLGLEVRNLTGP